MIRKTIEPQPARAAAYVAIYPMLLQVAKDHGYALAVHGSLHRDMDLVAVPWIEEASPALVLIKAMRRKIRAVTWSQRSDQLKVYRDCSPTEKPHGRRSYSLHVTESGMYGGYLDVSVMPRVKKRG